MRIESLTKVLPAIWEADATPMLVGPAGIGKSRIVERIGKELGRNVEILILSQMEPGDLIGMPMIDPATKQTVFVEPDWVKRAKQQPTIIFLDEINRSHSLVRAAIFQLILDKKIGPHTLPKDTYIVAAMNPATEDYEVDEIIDAALIDRFVWLRVTNDIEDWSLYMTKQDLGEYAVVIEDLVKEMGTEVFGPTDEIPLPEIKPTPRSHETFARIWKKIVERNLLEFADEIALGVLGKVGPVVVKRLAEQPEVRVTVEDLERGDVAKFKKATRSQRANIIRQYALKIIKEMQPELQKWAELEAAISEAATLGSSDTLIKTLDKHTKIDDTIKEKIEQTLEISDIKQRQKELKKLVANVVKDKFNWSTFENAAKVMLELPLEEVAMFARIIKAETTPTERAMFRSGRSLHYQRNPESNIAKMLKRLARVDGMITDTETAKINASEIW